MCYTLYRNSVKADVFSSSRPRNRACARLFTSNSDWETRPNARCCHEWTPDKKNEENLPRRTSLYNNFVVFFSYLCLQRVADLVNEALAIKESNEHYFTSRLLLAHLLRSGSPFCFQISLFHFVRGWNCAPTSRHTLSTMWKITLFRKESEMFVTNVDPCFHLLGG